MNSNKKNILIACSDKQDRLKFFNFFDALQADRIFTASDLNQMQELLRSAESEIAILAVEVSSHWIKSMTQLEQLKADFPRLGIVGLVSSDIRFELPEYQKIKKLVAKLVYSPLSHNQLVGSAELLLPETQQDGYVELDLYLNGPFQ